MGTNKNKVEWIKWIIQVLVAPIIVMVIGKYWVEGKINNVKNEMTVSINAVKTELNAYVDKRTNKINQSVSGTKNQSVSNAGDNNISIQNITETKPDFKKDSEQSNSISIRINEGVTLLRYNPCDVKTDEQFKKYKDAFYTWYSGTRHDLSKISNKAVAAFDGTPTSLGIEAAMSYNCHQETILLQKKIERYVTSLREILKGL